MQCGKMFTLQLVHIDQLHGVMTFLLSCTYTGASQKTPQAISPLFMARNKTK
jgi:hypothetical protein